MSDTGTEQPEPSPQPFSRLSCALLALVVLVPSVIWVLAILFTPLPSLRREQERFFAEGKGHFYCPPNNEELRDVVERYPDLHEVEIQGSEELSDISPLASLSGLESLSIAHCPMLKDFTPLRELRNLESLALDDTVDIDVSLLSGMTSLKSLSLGGHVDTHDLAALSGMTHLENLSLVGRDIRDLSPFSGMTHLKSLCIPRLEHVTDLGPLSTLSNLEELNIRGCRKVRDLSPLANLKRLKSLYAYNCPLIDGEQVSKLKRALPDCPIWLDAEVLKALADERAR